MKSAKGFILAMALIFNGIMILLLMGSFELTVGVLREHRMFMAYLDKTYKSKQKPDTEVARAIHE